MHYVYENFPFAGLDTLPDVVDAQLVNSKEENNFSMETSLHEFFFNVKKTHLPIFLQKVRFWSFAKGESLFVKEVGILRETEDAV